MSATCCNATEGSCTTTAETSDPSLCPVDRSTGKPVDWLTVAALSRGPVPARQQFRICRSPRCEVVYFGERGVRLGAAELRVEPGLKNGADALVCYCFLHRRSAIARELEQTGSTTVLEAIKGEVKAGNCACEVRNPSGKCCLGEVQATIRQLQQQAQPLS